MDLTLQLPAHERLEHALVACLQVLAEVVAADHEHETAARFLAAVDALGTTRRSSTAHFGRTGHFVFNPLSPREREVAGLVARGLTNRQIADKLMIGERTVDTHVQGILAKLGFESRTQIAAWAVEHLEAF